ncbi:MAG TPA: HD domain-containing protein [Candidatus Nanoarchaeia archaeon]|nr:HD domain-containing protein [Candidatus Nanoarchaeia archaeon]
MSEVYLWEMVLILMSKSVNALFEHYAKYHASLVVVAEAKHHKQDPAHDFLHGLQVEKNALRIAFFEGGDPEVVGPAGLMHDAVTYRKDDPRSRLAADESAAVVGVVLRDFFDFPSAKIPLVVQAVREHSYTRGLQPSSLESAIVQDADRLEALGAIGVLRVASLSGYMGKPLYCLDDPFCDDRQPGGKGAQLDLFYSRFLKTPEKMHTVTGRALAEERVGFMHQFLDQLRGELA